MKVWRGRVRCFAVRLLPFAVKSAVLVVLIFGNLKLIAWALLAIVVGFSIFSVRREYHVSNS